MHTVLIVEDETSQRLSLAALCENCSYKAIQAANGQEALFYLKKQDETPIDLIITDLFMPEMDGHELMRVLHEEYPHIPVIVVTTSDQAQDAVKMMQLGAIDFMTKPVQEERLTVSIRNAIKIEGLREEVGRLRRKEKGTFCFDDLIGHAAGLTETVTMSRKIAQSELPVLILGESGVGKEVFARAIHGESRRAGKPFIAVNCGAIPKNLTESTLFGHEKGSFTGAINKSLGKFREANGGTLFLDEIGELPLDTQVKLLRVLQQKEIEPVGLASPVKVDVRIISATNRNLSEQVKEGAFREDLFYRLNVLPLTIPPLRKRKDDIVMLAQHFLEQTAITEHQPQKHLSEEAVEWAVSYDWPGNVRELENTLSRAALLSEGQDIKKDDLKFLIEQPVKETDFAISGNDHQISLMRSDGSPKNMDELYDDIIRYTMEHCQHNVSEAAVILGIGQSTLYRKLGSNKKKAS